ncbi:MAG: glycoside hydrolase family 2 TIM barrel-domain containing protein [Opitutales bacterium]
MLALVFGISALPAVGAENMEGIPVYPREGSTLSNNAPMLVWTPAQAEKVELWMDGRILATLPGDAGQYAPFPLSFGPHRWKLVFVSGTQRTDSVSARFSIDDAPLETLPAGAVLLRDSWRMKSGSIAGMDGAAISSPGLDCSSWNSTSLPATVLTVLVRNGVYPNPCIGLNNMRIPDADDSFNEKNDLLKFSHIPGRNPWTAPYWFRTEFEVPTSYGGKRIWLTFNEINYRAELWLNGVKIAGPQEMAGMDRSFRFDVTKLADPYGINVLAVAIFPTDIPGEPSPPAITPLCPPGRNMGNDGRIALNYTKLDSSGWDWQPAVRDRDMGITEDVFLSATDNVEIRDLYVATDLPLPEVSSADITVSMTLANYANEDETGTLSATIRQPGSGMIRFERPYAVKAGQNLQVEWKAGENRDLHISRPQLWWPADMGAQPLYTLTVERCAESGSRSSASTTFGIREFETFMLGETRGFKINGKPVYCKGGNWVIDMALNWTASRYDADLRMARQAGLNFLRVWGPTGAPPQAFYDAADRYGILVQQDFLNDFWGMDKNDPALVPPEKLFREASAQIVRKYRNHPSLVIWCGGNEGLNQREDILIKEILPANDPYGRRFYLRASNQFGLIGGGPYHTLTPAAYFQSEKLNGFNSEIGPSGVPEIESLLKFLELPPKDWAENRFPLDACWAYHDATDRIAEGDQRKFSHYDDILRNFYGAPQSEGVQGLREYAAKAQLVNYDTYRAAIETLNHKLWKDVTGFALWKFNSSWPSVVWQLEDWYMQPNAGFYAVRKACEPVHIQLNRDDGTITYLNLDSMDMLSVKIRAELYDMSMLKVWSREQAAELKSGTVSRTGWSVPVQDGVHFLRLELLDESDNAACTNFYWLERNDDFKALDGMPVPVLDISSHKRNSGGRTTVSVTLRNMGHTLAFMLRARLRDRASGLEVLPSYWSDNYINLLPGESRVINVEVDDGIMPENWEVTIAPVLNDSPAEPAR